MIADRVKTIKASPIRRIAALLEKALENKSIISFGGGAPSFMPPEWLIEELGEYMKKHPEHCFTYGPTAGMLEVREAVAEMFRREDGIDLDAKNICLTDGGGTEALYAVVQALVNPGDEVIVADPTYLEYPEIVRLAGGKVVKYQVRWQDDFQIYPEKLAELVTKKTKLVMLCNPDNPTGRILEKENIKGIVELAQDYDFYVLSDEIYKRIVYEGGFVTAYKYDPERVIGVYSFSKVASMPGMRLGCVYGNEQIVAAVEKLNQYLLLCPNKTSQMAAKIFLDHWEEKEQYIERVVETYKKRRDAMGKYIKQYMDGVGYSTPKSGFFYFVDISGYTEDDEKVGDELLKKKNVVVIPGSFFGENGKGHIRMTFVTETEERIKEGVKKIGEYLVSDLALC